MPRVIYLLNFRSRLIKTHYTPKAGKGGAQ